MNGSLTQFTPCTVTVYNQQLLCQCVHIMYHYTKVACVRASVCAYEREVTGSHSTRGKEVFFSASVDMDVTTDSPLTRLAMAPAAIKVSCFKKTAGQN